MENDETMCKLAAAVKKAAEELGVHPDKSGTSITIVLSPGVPVHIQQIQSKTTTCKG